MIKTQVNLALKKWKFALNDKKFCSLLLTVLMIFAVQMNFISSFQNQIEIRQGVTFLDPLTNDLPVFSLDLMIFAAIYSAHLLGILLAILKPEKFFQILLGYFFVYFFRIFSQYLMPLNPPNGTIPLLDPLLIWFGNGAIITKDLFYSGHTSTTFMVFLVTENFKAKIYIFLAMLVIICGILLQRVHYSIDVYAAFFFAFTAYRLGIFILQKLKFIDFSKQII